MSDARRFGEGRSGSNAVLQAADVLGAGAVARVLELVDFGALVSVSRSRDGGAVAVTVTWDGEWEREWFRSPEEAQLALDEWSGMIEDLSREGKSPPAAYHDGRKRRDKRR